MATLSTKSNREDKERTVYDLDACLDPFAGDVERGREEGRRAGQHAGWNTGFVFGQGKALEYGIELGFFQGVVNQLQDERLLVDGKTAAKKKSSSSAKIQKTLDELQRLLDNFPTPQQMVQQQLHNRDERGPFESQEVSTPPPAAASASGENDTEGNHAHNKDIRHHLQRIRARFKLLTVQLGWSDVSSLQKLMDQAVVLEEDDMQTHEGQAPQQPEATASNATTKRTAAMDSSDW